VNCTGIGSGTATPNYTTGVIILDALATAPGNVITCGVGDNKIPTLKLQVTTIGGFGGAFGFAQTNLASVPSNITTTAANTPSPGSPTAININSIGTAITLNQSTTVNGFFLSGATCTDSNSSMTGNTGSFGTLSTNTLTVQSAKVVAGADLTCVFSDTKENPQLLIVKVVNTASPVSFGQTVTYSYRVTNVGNVAITNVTISDVHNGYGAPPVPQNELLTTDAAPTGDSFDAANNGSWDFLAPGDTITFTGNYAVVQADIDYHQ
jgi:hypothetical protein